MKRWIWSDGFLRMASEKLKTPHTGQFRNRMAQWVIALASAEVPLLIGADLSAKPW